MFVWSLQLSVKTACRRFAERGFLWDSCCMKAMLRQGGYT